jgi:short-subunit dehydrogenase
LAVTLARKGHAVLVVARREDQLQAVCDERIEEGTVHAFAHDITSPHATQVVLDEAVRVLARVHVLVNNARMSPYQRFEEMQLLHRQQAIALNVRALTELIYRMNVEKVDPTYPM